MEAGKEDMITVWLGRVLDLLTPALTTTFPTGAMILGRPILPGMAFEGQIKPIAIGARGFCCSEHMQSFREEMEEKCRSLQALACVFYSGCRFKVSGESVDILLLDEEREGYSEGGLFTLEQSGRSARVELYTPGEAKEYKGLKIPGACPVGEPHFKYKGHFERVLPLSN